MSDKLYSEAEVDFLLDSQKKLITIFFEDQTATLLQKEYEQGYQDGIADGAEFLKLNLFKNQN